MSGSIKKKSGGSRKRPSLPTSGRTAPLAVYLENHAALSEWLGVSIDTIRRWQAKGAPSKTARGYSLKRWIRWRISPKEEERAEGNGTNSKEDAELRLKTAQAEKVELDVNLRKGKTISLEQAEHDRGVLLQWLVSSLGRLSIELPAKVAKKPLPVVRKIVKASVNQLRSDMAQEGRSKTEVA